MFFCTILLSIRYFLYTARLLTLLSYKSRNEKAIRSVKMRKQLKHSVFASFGILLREKRAELIRYEIGMSFQNQAALSSFSRFEMVHVE